MLNQPALGDNLPVDELVGRKPEKRQRLFDNFDADLFPGQGLMLLLVAVSAIFLLILFFVDVVPSVQSKVGKKSSFITYKVDDPSIVSKNVNKYRSLSGEEKKVLTKSFDESWITASGEYQQYGAYRSLYSSLRAKYNVTKDPQILGQLKEIENFIASQPQWKEFYDASRADGGFL